MSVVYCHARQYRTSALRWWSLVRYPVSSHWCWGTENMITTLTKEQIAELLEAAESFLEAFNKLADFYENDTSGLGHVLGGTSFLVPRKPWSPGRDIRPQLREYAAEVDIHQGMAGLAVEQTGNLVTRDGVEINCAEEWRRIYDTPTTITMEDVQSSVRAAISKLRAWEFKSSLELGSPTITNHDVPELHPLVWELAEDRWTNGYYEEALKRVAQGLEDHWKGKLDFKHEAGHSFWASRIFKEGAIGGAPDEKRLPMLVYPCAGNRDTNINNREGMFYLALSLHKLARNTLSHSNEDAGRTTALGYLISYSTLATMLDECEIHPNTTEE